MRHRNRMLFAGALGNLVETFDLAICGLLSIYLAKYLTGDFKSGIAIIFATFFAGYLARPLGAVVMGLLSDVYGRKKVLSASILVMGITTALIGFIPSHNIASSYSICFLLFLRILQSFSCGSEYLNSSAYLVENAEKLKKGYSGSWASFGAMTGALVASITVWIVGIFCQKYPHMEWLIWRVPFMVALLGSSIGLYIRICVPESLEYVLYYAERPKPEMWQVFKTSMQHIKAQPLKTAYVFLLSCLGVSSTILIYVYAPTQAYLSGFFTHDQILLANTISLLVLLCVFPLMGKLSDRIKRSKIVIVASLGFMALFHPFFFALSNDNYAYLIGCYVLIAIPAAAYYAIVPVMLTEMYPLELRCTVLSIIYATAASFAAGLTPYLSYALINNTNIATSPAWWIDTLILGLFMTMKLYKGRQHTQNMETSKYKLTQYSG